MAVERMTTGPLSENTYLLYDPAGGEAFIVDPGGEPERLQRLIAAKNLTVKAIVNTHGHPDHIAAVKTLQEALNVPFYLHPDDNMHATASATYASHLGLNFSGVPRFDHPLAHDETLTLGTQTVRVIHTPGHTPGGVCLLMEGDLLSGDTLFAGSVGRSDLLGGNGDLLLRMIRERLLTLPPETRVHPGHGPSTTIGAEARHNPYLQG